MKKAFFTFALVSLATALKAQVAFSYHQSSIVSSFGVSTNPDKNVWVEGRISTNSSQFDITGMVLYNFVKRDDFKLYTGAGFGSVLFQGNFALALGFQVKPIEKKDNFSLFAEYTPLLDTDLLNYIGSGSIGIRYFLKKK